MEISCISLTMKYQSMFKKKKTKNLFKITLPKSKILRNKPVQAENYKTLIKETEDDSKKWKAVSCSRIRRISIVKMTILPKQSAELMWALSS